MRVKTNMGTFILELNVPDVFGKAGS